MKLETVISRIENQNKTIKRTSNIISKVTLKIQKLENNLQNETDEHEIYYIECDIRSAKDQIKDNQKKYEIAKLKLKEYQAAFEIEAAKQKELEIDCEVIEQFLEDWKTSARRYYTEQHDLYIACDRKHYEIVNQVGYFGKSNAEKRELSREYREEMEKFPRLFENGGFHDLEKHLENEVARKKEDLLIRITKVIGKITDASYLYIANDANLNGTIIGETGKAEIRTILAGGYNIQCLHYRVLVNKLS
ncbi:hypothetical protein [Clostridium sp.]|uniref:hypothetical protein n=1 Tax=Clostridium sp. TaxID=1506 RepID=UPI001A56D214|nr:hypothetical protein [Clostridium sp.]MBK5234038.1 hypothetical protein [Clostridium sp.]